MLMINDEDDDQVTFLASVAAECEWKEKEITVQEGEAVRFLLLLLLLLLLMMIVTIRFLKKFKKVKLCLDGKLQYKPIKDVEFTLACNGMICHL